jgi:hypothetical protein
MKGGCFFLNDVLGGFMEFLPAFGHTLANGLNQEFEHRVYDPIRRQSLCDCAALLWHHIHELLDASMEDFRADFVFDSELLPVPFPDFPQSVGVANLHR